MPKVNTGLWELNYIDEGEGPIVVLLHGLAGDHKAWLPQIAALKSKYRVIAIDNPGSGLSSHVTAPTNLKRIAQAVVVLLNHLGLHEVDIIGRSMGGAIAQEIALAAPQRVRGLALAGSFAKLDALGIRLIENMRDYIERDPDWGRWTRQFSSSFVATDFFVADAERMARLEAVIADDRRDRQSYIHLANACLASNTVGRLRHVRCKTLIMSGKLDPICSRTTTRWLEEEVPSAPSVIFERSSHFFLMEEAERANNVILDWLASPATEAPRLANGEIGQHA